MANDGLSSQQTFIVKNSKKRLNNFITSVSPEFFREDFFFQNFKNINIFDLVCLADLLEAQIKLAQQQCMNTLQACSTVAAQFIHFNKGKNRVIDQGNVDRYVRLRVR